MRIARRCARIGLVSTMVLGLVSCADSTAPSAAPESGRLIASGALTGVDGNPLPCCTVTTSGVRVTVLGGTLELHALAHYTDTVSTPAGLMSGACVQAIPSGAVMSLTGLVTLPDGSSYLALPCSVGSYRMTLTRQTIFADGSSQVTDTLLASGSFTWQRDQLTLVDVKIPGVTATLSGANVALAAPGHQYQFRVAAIE